MVDELLVVSKHRNRGAGIRVTQPLLAVDRLTTTLSSAVTDRELVSDVTFDVNPGEIVGIVGETGSGKTLTALSILRLLRPPLKVSGGRVTFKGRDLRGMSESQLQTIRGQEIGVVFQAARSALHPMLRVGDQIANVLRSHQQVPRKRAWDETVRMLEATRINDPERVATLYPHEISGGMAQRVLIAASLICSPSLLIADEPTTGLDVTVQLQILRLLRDLLREKDAAAIVITHDLGVVANFCDRVLVMYGGRLMESSKTSELFQHPLNPYTMGLLGAANLDLWRTHPELRLKSGVVDLLRPEVGCVLHPRCPFAFARCAVEDPTLEEIEPGHASRCHLARQL